MSHTKQQVRAVLSSLEELAALVDEKMNELDDLLDEMHEDPEVCCPEGCEAPSAADCPCVDPDDYVLGEKITNFAESPSLPPADFSTPLLQGFMQVLPSGFPRPRRVIFEF